MPVIILFKINIITLLNLFVMFKMQLNFSDLNNSNINIKSIIIILKDQTNEIINYNNLYNLYLNILYS